MKKFSCFFIFIFIIYTKCFGMGAGVRIGLCPSFNIDITGAKTAPAPDFSANIGGTVRLFRLPAQFSMGFEMKQDDLLFDYGVNADIDYFFFETSVTHNMDIYTGMGINGAILFNSKKENVIHSGLRLFFGYSWLWHDGQMELFTQINCNPLLEFRNLNPVYLKINVPVETGFRLHY